jgi:hypothetical protein
LRWQRDRGKSEQEKQRGKKKGRDRGGEEEEGRGEDTQEKTPRRRHSAGKTLRGETLG